MLAASILSYLILFLNQMYCLYGLFFFFPGAIEIGVGCVLSLEL